MDDAYRLNDPSFFATGDPDAVFRRLRRDDPVHWTETNLKHGFWSITKMEDLREVYRDHTTFSTERSHGPLPASPEAEQHDEQNPQSTPMLVGIDEPRHTQMRKAFHAMFLPRAVARYEETGRKLVAEIIDEVLPRGECDFVTDIATRLPMAIICDMMQVPRQDWKDLFHWANMAMGGDDPQYQIGTPMETADFGFGSIFRYTLNLGTQRRGGTDGDLMSIIANSDVQGHPLHEGEIGGNGFMFVIGGLETTRNAISGGMLELIRNPAEMRRLRADRALLPKAVEEIVRWTSPITHLTRSATRDVELRGRKIRKGDGVVVWNISANRDEETFYDPYRFDVGRTPNEHIGFGLGVHFCLGVHLARLELRLMLEQLLDRMPDLELAGEVTRLHSTLVAGIKSMPVRFTPRRAAA
jgi:cholest-4-en-3-one 26-monooxygenase